MSAMSFLQVSRLTVLFYFSYFLSLQGTWYCTVKRFVVVVVVVVVVLNTLKKIVIFHLDYDED